MRRVRSALQPAEEKSDIGKKGDGRACCRNLAAIDVDQIAHRLKRVEADADRQNNVQPQRIDIDPDGSECLTQRFEKKIHVLENAQNRQVGEHAKRDDKTFCLSAIHPLDLYAQTEIDRARCDQER